MDRSSHFDLGSTIGTRLVEIIRPYARVSTQTLELFDTIVMRFSDGKLLQLINQVHRKWSREMKDLADCLVMGDYDDRDEIVFQRVDLASMGFPVENVVLCLEPGEGTDYLFGLVMVGPNEAGISIISDTDELRVGERASLWDYLIATASRNRVFRFEPLVTESGVDT